MTAKNKRAKKRKEKILTQKFFERPALNVARNLLGKFLCRKTPLRRPTCQTGRRTSKCYMITETEAYDGFKDKASHAHRGRTARNAPMFGEAGRWYVYFTYGMHWMLNIVTGPKDYPAAVLIRGILGINGPAKLTKFLKIDKQFNNLPATRETGLWIEDRGVQIPTFNIQRVSRIGVDYAGHWSKKKYRFIIKTHGKKSFSKK